MSISARFKWNITPQKIVDNLQEQIDSAIIEFKKQMAEVIYKELSVQVTGPSFGHTYYDTDELGTRKVGKMPADTGTFVHSWQRPKEVDGAIQIMNKLPTRYIGATQGLYHQAGEQIVDPYNLYILEGFKAGAPIEYAFTSNKWEYMNKATGKLLDMSLLLWKYQQGALGDSPYMLMNSLMRAKVRRLYK